MLGSILEQGIGTGRADIGKSIAGGLSNAVSGAVYGNMPLKNLADAAGRGALSGAALSAIDYLFGTGGKRESTGRRAPGGNGRSDGLSPYAQRRDPRNGCRKSSVHGNGIWNEKTYGYQYHIPGYESSGQRKPEGFSLAEFAKAAALGAIMGGLSGAAFYGLDKATGALRRSVEGSRASVSEQRADFYVRPNGDVVPSAGYRYSARNVSLVQNARNGYIASRNDGMYFSFNKIDDSIIAQGKLQIPYRPEYRISFDTLNVINDISIPRGHWGSADYLEPITKDFKNFGPGGATQAVTYSKVTSVRNIFKLR